MSATDFAEPDPNYVEEIVGGLAKVSSLGEAIAIVARAEKALEFIEPTDGILSILEMIINVYEAMELPERTCGYQGLCYGLMYTVLGMGDPAPNSQWPSRNDAPNGDQTFRDGVQKAKRRLQDGRDGVIANNWILLSVARDGPKPTVNRLWQAAVSDDDRLLRMYTIEWPNVGPNGG